MNDSGKDKVKALLAKGVEDGVYPGAVLLVAVKGEMILFKEAGHRSIIPKPELMEKDTIFDLASLTKPLAATLAAMKMMDEGRFHLDQPITEMLEESLPKDKQTITPRLLLCHSAGLMEWRPFYLELDKYPAPDRKELLREWIIRMPLVYRPGDKSLYSDIGFIILEWLLEEKGEMPLHLFMQKYIYGPLELHKTFLMHDSCSNAHSANAFAATEDCPWRRKVLRGIVHDENAYSLGGYSGHAGLFGTAEEVYTLTNLMRQHILGQRDDYWRPDTVREFLRPQKIPKQSTWALGWDTPSPENSSSGKHFSPQSAGHLGFTGTSLWMDLEQDVIVILLTNRIHPTRNNEKIRTFRPKIHNLIMEEFVS